MTLSRTAATLLVGLLAASCSAMADNGVQQFVQIAAMLRAGAETCNAYSARELNELRDHQKSAVAALGVSPVQFDEMFSAGYAKAREILNTFSPAETAEICEE